MFARAAECHLKELVRRFPAITVVGPRQSGKTTLARMTFPGHAYANLEESATRALAEGDPRGFLARFPAPAIIDEIQRVRTDRARELLADGSRPLKTLANLCGYASESAFRKVYFARFGVPPRRRLG